MSNHSSFHVRGACAIFKFRSMFNVKLSLEHDAFACPACEAEEYNKKELEKLLQLSVAQRKRNKKMIIKLKREIKAASDHHWMNVHQRNEYNHLLHNLGVQDSIIVIDFTSVGEYGSPQIFQVFVLSEITRNPSGEIKIKYYDFYKVAKNDFFFFKAVMELYFTKYKKECVKNVFIWSDGAKKHFKQRFAMYFMSTLPEKYSVNVQWHFYCSNHAHNICDGHAAKLKKILRDWQKKSGRKIPESVDFRIIVDKAVEEKHLSDMIAVEMQEIQNSTFDSSKMPRISFQHCFVFVKAGTIQYRLVSDCSRTYPSPALKEKFAGFEFPSK